MATPWSKLKRGWSVNMADNQERILNAVRHGDFVKPETRTIFLLHPKDPALGAFVTIWNDALKLGTPDDNMRVTVSHRTAQAIADLLNVRVPTARLVDASDDSVIEKIEPGNWLRTEGAPNTLAAMEADHASIEAALADFTKPIVSPGTPWKLWINHPRLAHPERELQGKRTGINYGGFTARPAVPQGVVGPKRSVSAKRNVWQEPGGFHDVDHSDESQKAWFVLPLVSVLWKGIADLWTLDDVARHPELSWIVSHSGPILMRHPWLPLCKSLDEGGACEGGFGAGGGGGGGPAPADTKRRLTASGAVIALSAGLVYALWRWL